MKTFEWLIAGFLLLFVVVQVIRNWPGFVGGAL